MFIFKSTKLIQSIFSQNGIVKSYMKFSAEAEKHKIHLNANYQKNLPRVYADIAMIERALSNLIDNAIHNTPENGSIVVELQQIDNQVRVMVNDTGFGISEKDLPHIFDRFYKCEKRKAQKSSSTGLGLAIAKKILELHDSIISVESKISIGTKFYFDLDVYQRNFAR